MTTKRRMRRIFKTDGRALIVAMDHGLVFGPCKGLERPGEAIERVVRGGADAILTSYGIASKFPDALAGVGLIIRLDGGSTDLGGFPDPYTVMYRIEDALRLGADAVAVCAYPDSERERETLYHLAKLCGEAHAWGVPVMAEMIPGGFSRPSVEHTDETISIATRIGAELGADIIKTPYVKNFGEVAHNCFVPVVILGGAKRGDEGKMVEDIKAAFDAGASGVAMGRNIFQAQNPQAMTSAIAAILHGNASLEEAVDRMRQS
jgi:DhnA family fructose-bisphosphate aldolase class Ia